MRAAEARPAGSKPSVRHWLPLIAADKINVLEGLIDAVMLATVTAVAAGVVFLLLPKKGGAGKHDAAGNYKSGGKR